MLNQSTLKQLLHYDPVTGNFRRRPSPMRSKWWNSKHAGKVAGWTAVHDGTAYVRLYVDGRHYFAHRLAWLYMTGDWPSDEVDHRDGDGTNNVWANLRAATKSQNNRNQGIRSTNTSGFKNVSWDRDRGKWAVIVMAERKRRRFGRFDNIEDAISASIRASSELHGEFAANPSRCGNLELRAA